MEDGVTDISEPDSPDTCRNSEDRGETHGIAQTISQGESDGILVQFAAMRFQPDMAHPIENDGRDEQQGLRIAIEETDVLTVDVETENHDGSKCAADSEDEDEFAIIGDIAAAGLTAVYELFGMDQFRIALGHSEAEEEEQREDKEPLR